MTYLVERQCCFFKRWQVRLLNFNRILSNSPVSLSLMSVSQMFGCSPTSYLISVTGNIKTLHFSNHTVHDVCGYIVIVYVAHSLLTDRTNSWLMSPFFFSSRCFMFQRVVLHHRARWCYCTTTGPCCLRLPGSRAAPGHHQVAEEWSSLGREWTHTLSAQRLLVHTKDKAYQEGIRWRILPVPLSEQIWSYPKPKISSDYRK